ncbi:hypothetical protein ACIQGZ_08570 [Streptomyces sp. NPDC092296]|uniref:hypothetical protein n=1 Tax=Streptomyces sp. NPDC092296 TaxID=3366012 RepID=UPI0038279AF7
MEPELLSLANNAGTTLVQLIATDGWEHVSAALTRWWHRHRQEDADLVESDLAETRENLVAAASDPVALRMAVTAWQLQFRSLLAAAPPGAADELRALMANGFVTPTTAQGASYTGDVHMRAQARDSGTVNQLGQGTMNVTGLPPAGSGN